MQGNSKWLHWATECRTIWFLIAMIPGMVVAFFVGLLSLVLTTPLMVYASIRGKHLKDPWRDPHRTRQ